MGNEAETALYLARTPQMTHGTMGSGDNRHRTIPHPAPESWFLTQASCTCLAPFGGSHSICRCASWGKLCSWPLAQTLSRG